MKRYLCVQLLLWSALSLAQVSPFGQPVIDSASVNYTTNTITIVGRGFCPRDRSPIILFGTTRLELESTSDPCTSLSYRCNKQESRSDCSHKRSW